VKWTGVLAGAFVATLAVGVLWGTALVDPPEGVSRGLAVLSAVYPGRLGGAQVERIPCPPLKHLRLYVVCTENCEQAWVVVGVRGLSPENLANLGRLPPQPPEESAQRIGAAVAQDDLSLDSTGAREMAACYLRLEGFLPGLVLTPLDLVALEGARGDEEAMRRLAEGLDTADAPARIETVESDDGFLARMFYWDTSLPGRPVLEMTLRMARNGVLRSLEVQESLRGGSVAGSSPGIPPS
jgi:hypothetical protein